MKRKKLLRKIRALLSADRREQLARYKSLEKVLRKLKDKEDDLRTRLDEETDDERRRDLRAKLKVIAAQRKKGLKLRAELEQHRNDE